MAFADPQAIKVSGVTTTLPRVDSGNYRSVYQSSDGKYKLTISTQEGKRKRHSYRVDVSKIAPDPLTAVNSQVGMSAYIVIDRPLSGFDNTESLAIVVGLLEAATEATNGDLTKLLGSES